MRMVLASAVSLPTLVARNLKLPVLLSVPPITSSPILSTVIDSPVTRLVDGTGTFLDLAINGHLVARTDDNGVSAGRVAAPELRREIAKNASLDGSEI